MFWISQQPDLSGFHGNNRETSAIDQLYSPCPSSSLLFRIVICRSLLVASTLVSVLGSLYLECGASLASSRWECCQFPFLSFTSFVTFLEHPLQCSSALRFFWQLGKRVHRNLSLESGLCSIDSFPQALTAGPGMLGPLQGWDTVLQPLLLNLDVWFDLCGSSFKLIL